MTFSCPYILITGHVHGRPLWTMAGLTIIYLSSGHRNRNDSAMMPVLSLLDALKAVKLTAFNSLDPGKYEWNFRHVIFTQILVIDGWDISCKIALIWMSLDFADDLSTLVQVMACCRQATSHYLSQCWPRSMSPNGVTRSQWVNTPHDD